jgi:hypothetical protein
LRSGCEASEVIVFGASKKQSIKKIKMTSKMKLNVLQFSALAILLCLFTQVNAQQADDEAIVARDRAEIVQFRGYENGLKTAVSTNSLDLARAHHMKMVNAMQREITQAEDRIAAEANDARLSRTVREREILDAIKAIDVQNGPNPLKQIDEKMGLIEEFEQMMITDMGDSWEEPNQH